MILVLKLKKKIIEVFRLKKKIFLGCFAVSLFRGLEMPRKAGVLSVGPSSLQTTSCFATSGNFETSKYQYLPGLGPFTVFV